MSTHQKYGSILVGLLSLVVIGVILVNLSGFATAAVSGLTNIAAPANGTATFQNVTFQAQEYVGFYGNVSTIVMRSGGDVGQSMLNHTMRNGSVFITKTGNTFNGWALTAAPTNERTDGNISLTGEYSAKWWFSRNGTEGCGVPFDTENGLPQLNTTDNFTVSLLQNGTTGSPAFLTCSHINLTVSANGFGVMNYQLIAPKTSTWTAYDFYVEGGYT